MTDNRGKSPRIKHLSWGRMEIEGVGSGKDFKLWPGGGRAWDWNETGTRHIPGIQPSDVTELLDHGATEVVLSRGILKALQTCDETRKLLQEKGVTYHIEETKQAATLYNERVEQGVPVAGLFHSTC